MEDDDVQCIGELSKPENPQFRKDVEDILGRPYDEKEYETLWLQVNSRKPVQGYRELRGNLKAYSKDTVGKSYLDEYLGKLITYLSYCSLMLEFYNNAYRCLILLNKICTCN